MIKFILACLLGFASTVHAYTIFGSDSTIDIMTWNMEYFPKNGSTTINEAAIIIKDLDVDIIAVEEISDTLAFKQLLSQLPGWAGIVSPEVYNDGTYQKVGLLYNQTIATVIDWQLLFEDDDYAFPRAPIEFTLNIVENGNSLDFRLIVVHLKAYSGEDNEARRRSAVESLKLYIDEQVQISADDDFVLTGDFNDHLEDPPQDNVFTAILEDTSNYSVLTKPLSGYFGSYIGYSEPNLIDHVIISSDALTEFGSGGITQALYLDEQNPDYAATVSDHRPVLARFAFDNTSPVYNPIYDLHAGFDAQRGKMLNIKGIVTVGSSLFSTSYTTAYIQDESGAGINIYFAYDLIQTLQTGDLVELTGQLTEYNGLHELEYLSHQVLATNQDLPEDVAISTAEINDTGTDPGRRVQVSGIIESKTAEPNVNMMINDGSGSGKIYFDPDAGLDVSTFAVGETITVIGVKTVYNQAGQVQPAYQEDITKGPPATLPEIQTARRFHLIGNFPNPFNPGTSLRFELPDPAGVELKIFSADGRQICLLNFGRLPAGYQSVYWNGRDRSGSDAVSGVYFYQLSVNSQLAGSGKMLKIK